MWSFYVCKLTFVYRKASCQPVNMASIASGFVWISHIPIEQSERQRCCSLESFSVVYHMSSEAYRRTRKGDFGQNSAHVSGRRYTFRCMALADKEQGILCSHIRDLC